MPSSRRWVVLAAGTFVQTSQAAMYAGLAVLAPVLRDRYDLTLTEIGVLLGGSSVGALLTLLPWGLAADRVGERLTATVGLVAAAAGLSAAAYAGEFVTLLLLFFAASAFGASTNTATGRAITSWFPREGRGFALGIRQTAIPIGGFTAALGLPPVVDAWGLRAALLALASFSLLAAVTAAALLAEGPIRSLEDEADLLRHPLRDRRIWRVSLGSALLAVTQVAVAGFVVLFLESQRDFSHAEAGAVLAGMNVIAAAGRLGSGRLSDRVGSRIGLMRGVSLAAAVTVGLATALLDAPSGLFLPALILGGGLAMSWNGLAVAATVEAAGARKSGAALGFQQTLIQVGIVATPLVFAPFVAATSWRAGFGVAAAVPIAAVLVLRPLGR
ncbi:MAG TPA: MFS transporter [Gaiellaceae bacterium]|nr:MFS transporter [Gaiellaceae bacterium]